MDPRVRIAARDYRGGPALSGPTLPAATGLPSVPSLVLVGAVAPGHPLSTAETRPGCRATTSTRPGPAPAPGAGGTRHGVRDPAGR
ncbi:hypothetical protein GCM10010393_33940 [Streptomyces gobitricini]|uniref:Uncharacterized protein n=1 Tax=Streptomyces gobitricini TaxID=68211 RepID=A0ABP5ZQ84_9ACTN